MRRRYAFQIVAGHRHGRCQERGLQVKGHENPEKQRIDTEVCKERQKNRHKNDYYFTPFQRPAEQEDDTLGQHQKGNRMEIEAVHKLLDHHVAAEVGEYR